MSGTTEPIVFEILPDGRLTIPAEQLQQAGFTVGDQLVISAPAPGHLYLHKFDPMQDELLSREELSQLMKQAFRESGYTTREQIVGLVREVRKEMVGD